MKKILITILLIMGLLPAMAQLTPLKSQFFHNPYLANPAMAGIEERTSIYSNYSNQWNKLEGAPVMFSLSATTPLNEKASIGVNFINDKAGLMLKTQAMGSFAYNVPFSQLHSIRFGVSISWAQDRIDQGLASAGAANDMELSRYNDRENYLDGNFGLTYINHDLEIQFSYLNLNQRRLSRFSTVDYATFYSSIAYHFQLNELFSVKPLLTYRGVKNFDNQYDITAEWKADDLAFYTMYHSNNSFTGGVGYDYKKQLKVAALYNSEPNTIRGLSGGIFDLVVGYRF
ncbi:MAG: type IX secretion system membrane protein PorP/SprF [Flavobacteriales bacterium]|nr:MAG: type IX secretion system membrane protein PorP/SprF [Flavobacteriales bacterium]